MSPPLQMMPQIRNEEPNFINFEDFGNQGINAPVIPNIFGDFSQQQNNFGPPPMM